MNRQEVMQTTAVCCFLKGTFGLNSAVRMTHHGVVRHSELFVPHLFQPSVSLVFFTILLPLEAYHS